MDFTSNQSNAYYADPPSPLTAHILLGFYSNLIGVVIHDPSLSAPAIFSLQWEVITLLVWPETSLWYCFLLNKFKFLQNNHHRSFAKNRVTDYKISSLEIRQPTAHATSIRSVVYALSVSETWRKSKYENRNCILPRRSGSWWRLNDNDSISPLHVVQMGALVFACRTVAAHAPQLVCSSWASDQGGRIVNEILCTLLTYAMVTNLLPLTVRAVTKKNRQRKLTVSGHRCM